MCPVPLQTGMCLKTVTEIKESKSFDGTKKKGISVTLYTLWFLMTATT